MKVIYERRAYTVNYALDFNQHSKHLFDIDEIIVKYEGNEDKLRNFLTEHRTQKITISIETFIQPQTITDLLELKKEGYSFSVRSTVFLPEHVDLFKKAEIPFFIKRQVMGWDEFLHDLEFGVSEIYISGSLGFELQAVSALAKEHNVKLRAIPNIAQGCVLGVPPLKRFFIRPEDIELYSLYIDTFELQGPHDKMDTIYTIYRSGRWYGNIRELIIGFDTNLDTKHVIPIFGEKRLDCGRRCLKGKRCHLCDSISKLAETLGEKGLILTPPRKKEEPQND